MTRTTFTAAFTAMILFSSMGFADATEARKWKKRQNNRIQNVIIASDLNNRANPTVQPEDSALAGGDRDQTLQFGDVLQGTEKGDLIIGKLGTDFLFGKEGNDVLVGGTEDFNPFNRDRAYGGRGHDIFLWAPGDGSDFFDGGKGQDAVIFGKIGEIPEQSANIEFNVSLPGNPGSGDSDPIFLNPLTNLPLMDVSRSPGFCEIIDESNAVGGKEDLDALGIDHLVKFLIRGVADAFENKTQTTDNGLRVTLHLKDVETLVCTNRAGGLIQVFDLTQSPPQEIDLAQIQNRKLRKRIKSMVF